MVMDIEIIPKEEMEGYKEEEEKRKKEEEKEAERKRKEEEREERRKKEEEEKQERDRKREEREREEREEKQKDREEKQKERDFRERERQRIERERERKEREKTGVKITGDIGEAGTGIGNLLFMGVAAFILYKIYSGSSLASASLSNYVGLDNGNLGNFGLNNGSWKPLSDIEIQNIRYIVG